MSTNALTKVREMLPSVFDDFFNPWNEWYDGGLLKKTLTMPAVNITEEKTSYLVTLAVPGMKKSDFNIDVNGNILSISAAKEEEKEEKDKKFTRKEYNYSSFSRSFTLPEEVVKDKIEANYGNGILSLSLPKKEDKKHLSTKIDVK